MVVPARPAAGSVVDEVWGQVAHDTAVAQDLQAGNGTATFPNANQASAVITFPRPFASPPFVVVNVGPHNAGGMVLIFAQTGAVTATNFTVRLVSAPGTASTQVNVPFHWMAYGPRA